METGLVCRGSSYRTSAMQDLGAASAVVLSPTHPLHPPSPTPVCPDTRSCPEAAPLYVQGLLTRSAVATEYQTWSRENSG